MSHLTCHCGGNVAKIQAKSRFFPFGEYGQVRLTRNCKVPTCDRCGEVFLGDEDSKVLDDALRASLTDNAVEVIEYIRRNHGLRENQLAFFCSVTPAAFSRFKNRDSGKVIPPYAFLLLKGVAMTGKHFMDTLLNGTWDADPVSSESHHEPLPVRPVAAKPAAG